ncbi:hypothetical protein Tco_0697213 [Tanacetum coccineum]
MMYDVPEDGRVSLGDHHHMSFFGDGHTADVSDLPYSLELSPVIDASSVGDFSVINGHLGNDDLLETNEISYSARIRVKEAMAEEDAFLVDDVEGGLCVDNTDAGIDGRFNSGSNKDKGKVGER